MVAWVILGLGNVLGAWWAYHVLGWGGYWGWDPVENVALMPWLVGTAFIHSIQMQERRGMLKAWNILLVMVAFFLSIFGTFVVRSGILASVHAFALSAIGPYFLTFLALVIVGGLFVIEALSVIVQVAYFKRTKKRIFLMAPLHHHFERKGWTEPQIVIRFWIIAVVLALVGLSTLKLR